MNRSDEIPAAALKMAERNETFRKYIENLNSTIVWYNKIRRTSKDVEFQLIESEIEEVDRLIQQGQTSLSWNSEGNFVSRNNSPININSRSLGVHGKIARIGR